MAKYIFITGGVVSSLGKGVAASSVGAILEARGFSVEMMKLDPYVNVDPGTMSPYQHGEVFVTDDGAEADLDLGHYERFTGVQRRARSDNVHDRANLFEAVINKERQRGLPGQHRPGDSPRDGRDQEVRDHGGDGRTTPTSSCVEIGGTVGDIEGPCPSWRRSGSSARNSDATSAVSTSISPWCPTSPLGRRAEDETHPALGAGTARRSASQPDILLCRVRPGPAARRRRRKIALFCNVADDAQRGRRPIDVDDDLPKCP